MPIAQTVSSSTLMDTPQSSDGLAIGQSAAALIGFYGAAPVAQQVAATNVHTVAAGSVTSVFVNTTFDGSIGSTAYTLGDLVAALKNLGLIAK